MVMLMNRTRIVVWLYFSKMSEKEAKFLPRLDLNLPWEAGRQSQYCMVPYVQIPYSGKYSWGPNFVLFVHNKNLTHETYVMMGVFSCVKNSVLSLCGRFRAQSLPYMEGDEH